MSPKPLLVLLVFLTVASPSYGERFGYHVVGSYAELSNARQEQARLADQLLADVLIVSSKDSQFNRLLVTAEQVTASTLDDAGIPHWLLVLDQAVETGPIAELSSVPEPEPGLPPPEPVASDIVPVPAPSSEPTPSEPALPEIREDESLTEYCSRVAVPVCQRPMARWVMQKEARLEEGRAALHKTCRNSDEPGVTAICQEFFH